MSKLYAIYGRAGALERGFTPYRGLGADPPPFVLSGATLTEFKRALVEVARRGADPLLADAWCGTMCDKLNYPSSRIVETFWKHIDVSSSVWEPALSDELAMFLSRYWRWGKAELELEPPYMQLAPEVGPTPTLAAMRLLAAVARKQTGGAVTLAQFEQWYDANDEPEVATIEAVVAPPCWYPLCVGRDQIPNDVASADAGLVTAWKKTLELEKEEERSAFAATLWTLRAHRIALAQQCLLPGERDCCSSGGLFSAGICTCIPPKVLVGGKCESPGLSPAPKSPAQAPPTPPSTANVVFAVVFAGLATLGVRWAFSQRRA